MNNIDVAIIGAGTAGINAQRGATAAGASAVMFDPGTLGTTCARVGCMPSKVLIACAEQAHAAKNAGDFGVNIGSVDIDGEAVMSRVQGMRDGFVSHTVLGIERIEDKGGLIREAIRFRSAHELEAGGEQYNAKAVVIATGSSPWIPPPYRGLGSRLLTTDQIFELPTLPKSLLVVGAGVIGVELALAFARLGVRVTVVELEGRLAGLDDPKVRAAAYSAFSDELDLQTNYTFGDVAQEGDEVRLRFVDDDGRERDEKYEYALVATGRRPNLSGLGLEELNLGSMPEMLAKVDPRTGQLGDSHIFFAGDVTDTHTLLHEAVQEGRTAGGNAARYPKAPTPTERMTGLGIVFSDPEIATVGMPFNQLPEGFVVGELDYAGQSRAKVLGKARGLLRIYANPGDGRLLGATVFGPDAEYLGHLLSWTIESGKTAKEALAQPFYHPTIVESIQSALRRILKSL